MRALQRQAPGADGTGDATVQIARIVGAVARARVDGESATRTAGEHLDDPADRVRTVETRCGPAQDFDVVDLVERDRFQRGRSAARRTDAQAVEQQQRLIAVGAAEEHAGRRARTAVGHDLDARLALQQLGQALRAGTRNLVGADVGYIRDQLGEQLRRSRGSDHDGIHDGRGIGRPVGVRGTHAR
jgi:hypothetical protein